LVTLRKNFFQRRAVFKIDGHVNRVRYILLIEIDLLQQGREELAWLESRACYGFAQVLPEELAPVHDLSTAHMEEVYRHHPALAVIAEDVGIVTFNGGDALLLLEQIDRRDQVTVLRRQLVLLALGGGHHALLQRARQIGAATLQKQLHVMHRFGVALGRGEPFHARAQTAANVELQARPRIIAVEVQLARRNKEVPMDEIYDSVRQARRKERPVIK